MKYGYARISTDAQNADLQIYALKQAQCDHIFKDQATGSNTKRPALKRCLKDLRAGDILVVWKLDRLGRSLSDLITLLDDFKERGIRFQSLTEEIDTETIMGRAMWQFIGLLAELERNMIIERTQAGLQAAKRRGVKLGRKPLLKREQMELAEQLIESGKTQGQVADFLRVGRVTLYRARRREKQRQQLIELEKERKKNAA
jgi:DNA invertase Pin-like site-specific DNA recombinase